MRRNRWFLAVTLLLALSWLAACSATEDTAGGLPDFRTMQAELQAFQSCSEVEDYLREVVLAELDEQVAYYEECMNDPYNCYYYGVDVAVGAPTQAGGEGSWDAVGEPAPSAGADDGSNGGSEGSSEEYSRTNTQEDGVDEADIIKSDGTHIFALQAGSLHIVKAAPAEDMDVIGSLAIEGSPIEMFLSSDATRIAVFSRDYRYNDNGTYGYEVPPDREGGAPEPAEPPDAGVPASADDDDAPGETETPASSAVDVALDDFQGGLVKLSIVDVSDPTAPQLVHEAWFEAGYVSSRMVDDRVHLVASAYPRIPSFAWYGSYDYGDDGVSEGSTGSGSTGVDPAPAVDAGAASGTGEEMSERKEALEAWEMTLEEAAAAYREEVDAATLEDVMPRRLDVVDGEPVVDFLVPCANFFHPSEVMGLNMLAVLSFDLSGGDAAVDATGILGSSDTVYASATTLYASTFVYDYWRWARVARQDPGAALQRTAIHAFDISAGSGPAPYLASGIIEGDALNQFSFSEYDGHLRVATTTQTWDQEDWSSITNNAVSILERHGDELRVVGYVDGLGEPGEQIFAARFLGDKGFVVTYEQQDPLVTLDLSDPTSPQVMGELHISGFSSYIHPLGADHLLTIGRDSSQGEDGWNDAVKLAIYDISDLANPQQLVEPMLLAGADSVAEYDHKAFNYFTPEGFDNGLLAIPIASYWWNGDGSEPENGLAVFEVDTANGFTRMGTVSHMDLVGYDEMNEDEMYCGWYLPRVQRSVFIGERVYSISDMGVKVNSLDSALTELNATLFPDAENPYYGDYGYGDCYMGGTTVGVDEPAE